MPPLVVIDARDAAASQPRGWSRYASCLIEALSDGAAAGLELEAVADGGSGPEVFFEQFTLPLLLRRRGASLVHSPNCFLPLLRPCAGVVTVHDLAFEVWPRDFAPRTRLKYRLFTRLAARSAQRLICPSRFTADDLTARYGVLPEKIRVIPEAPALPAGDAPAPPGPYLLAVGDLRQKKNLGMLIEAYLGLRHAQGIGQRLVIAGLDSGEGKSLRALAGREPVELTGYLGDSQLDALIRGADLLVYPSLYEGFGLVLLEAMVRGIPVLAARCTALPETGGDAAAYFDPHTEGDLGRMLGRLLGDPDLRSSMARRGREHAAQFSWDRTARQTVDVYRELL